MLKLRIERVFARYFWLLKLSMTPSQNYDTILSAPCVDEALPVGEITSEDDILSLLHVFEASAFSFAAVEDADTRASRGLVSLGDILELYQREAL